jgi:hypothetical protein
MKTARFIIFPGLALCIGYGIAAFVAADFAWAKNLWVWDRGDRAFFLYGAGCFVLLGALIACHPAFSRTER